MTTREEMVKAADDARAAWNCAGGYWADADNAWGAWNDARLALIAYDGANVVGWFVGYLEALFEDREVVVLAEYEREVEQFLW